MRGEHSLEPGGPTLDAIDTRDRQQRTTLHHTHAMSGQARYLSDALVAQAGETLLIDNRGWGEPLSSGH
jgi:hypothetical protein